jgi:hypothetical protein
MKKLLLASWLCLLFFCVSSSAFALGIGKGIGANPPNWQTPKYVFGNALRLWLRADQGFNGSTTWNDMSGNGFNGTGGAGVALGSGIGGQSAINFTASTGNFNFVHGNTILNGTAANRFVVMQGAADAPSALYVDNANWSGQGSASNIPFTDGNIYDGFARTTRPGFVKGSSFASPIIYSSESSGSGGTGAWQARANGVVIAASVTATNTYGVNALNATLQAGATAYQMAEVVMLNVIPTTAQRDSLLQYLHQRYGIAVTL